MDDPVILVCAGPPACSLQDEQAVAAQASCPWCTRIYTSPLGDEVVGPYRDTKEMGDGSG